MAEYDIPTSGSTSLFYDKRYWDGDTLNLTGSYTGNYTMSSGETINGGSISGTITIDSNCSLNSVSLTGLDNADEASNYNVTSCSISTVSLTNSMIGTFSSCSFGTATIGKDCIGVVVQNGTFSGSLNMNGANTCKFTSMRGTSSGIAISLTDSTKCKVSDCIVYNSNTGIKMKSCISCSGESNLFYNCSSYGIILDSNEGCSVNSGQVKNCGTAVYLTNNDSNTCIASNIITNNSKGVVVTTDDNTIVSGNRIKNNSSHGVEIYEAGKSIINTNTISNNSGNGVYCYNTDSEIFITNNTIKYNSGNGIYCNGITDGSISGNTIESNSKYGVLLDSCTTMNTSHDTIKYHSDINEYLINCTDCSIGAISSYSKLGMKIYKCSNTSVSLSEITNCTMGVLNNESDSTSFAQTEVYNINLISPTYTKEGEYELSKSNTSWFTQSDLMSLVSIGIYDLNSSNTIYDDCTFSNNKIALFIKNTDGVKIRTNLFLDNYDGIVIDKSQSFQIVTNRILQTDNIGILIHSNLTQTSKLSMNGMIDTNVVSKCRLYYNSDNFRIPEYIYPFNTYAIRFKAGIEMDDDVIDGYDNITTIKALIDINDYVNNASNTHIYIDFMDDYSQVKTDYPLRFIKQSLDDLTTIDDYESDDEYDIFFFTDTKQIAVLDNSINKIYIDNRLDELITSIDSDKASMYEYRKSMTTLIRDYAKEMRELSLEATSVNTENATSFLNENTANDKYIKSNLTDQTLQITTNAESESNPLRFNISSLYDD